MEMVLIITKEMEMEKEFEKKMTTEMEGKWK